MMRTLPFLAFAAGCGAGTCEKPWYLDRDGDGWGDRADPISGCEAPEERVDRPGDCDDRDPAVNPGRSDGCNGVDDDCDGAVDPEATLWYADADRDGFGNADLTTRSCGAPAGFVDAGADCDDDDGRAHPGADERCNGKDDDCDTLVDEGAPGDEDWYPDDDGDGWGDTDRMQVLCEGPIGWVRVPGDCDDSTWQSSPGQAEICDGYDNDCDRAVDAADESVSGAFLVWADDDRDAYGDPASAPELACQVTPGLATNALDCDDGDADLRPDAQEVCGGGDEDCDGLVDDADPSVDTSTGTLGWLDADGDGLGDPGAQRESCALEAAVVTNDDDCDDGDRAIGTDWWLPDADLDGVGAGTPVAGAGCVAPPGHANAALVDCAPNNPAIAPGRVDVCGDLVDQDCSGIDRPCRGPLSAFQSLDEAAGPWGSAGVGFALAAAGDVDGDGGADLAWWDGGVVTLAWGPGPELPGPVLETSALALPASGAVTLLGVGDTDADARDDVVVGSPDTATLYVASGQRNALTWRSFLVGAVGSDLGLALAPSGLPPDGSGAPALLAAEAQGVKLVRVPGPAGFAQLTSWSSTSVLASRAGGGDLDGDGVPDFAVGSPTEIGGSGMLFVVPTNAPGGDLSLRSPAEITGDPGQQLGTALALGDLTGDGLDDLLASASLDDAQASNAGAVYGWSEPLGALVGSASADLAIRGDGAGAKIGTSLLAADVDGDGAPDLAIGASDVDVAGPQSGAVYLFAGPLAGGPLLASDADWILRAGAEDEVGRALGLADLDGDRVEDLLVSGEERWWWVPGI